MQMKTYRLGIHDLDLTHPLVQDGGFVTLEAKRDVFGGKWVAIVEGQTGAQCKLIDFLIGAHGPGFRLSSAPWGCQAWASPGHHAGHSKSRRA